MGALDRLDVVRPSAKLELSEQIGELRARRTSVPQAASALLTVPCACVCADRAAPIAAALFAHRAHDRRTRARLAHSGRTFYIVAPPPPSHFVPARSSSPPNLALNVRRHRWRRLAAANRSPSQAILQDTHRQLPLLLALSPPTSSYGRLVRPRNAAHSTPPTSSFSVEPLARSN